MSTTPATTQADGVTDEQIEALALEYIAPHYGMFGHPGEYKETEQFLRVARFARALLSLATPSPGKAPEPVAWLSQYRKRDNGNRFDIVEPGYRATNPEFWTDGFPVYASPGKADEEDAARYRWLRDYGYEAEMLFCATPAAALDESIDAAIQQERDK